MKPAERDSTVSRPSPPTVALVSLGCAKNQVDSEQWLSSFLEMGFRDTRQARDADLVIVNTCGFIGPAKEESVEAILDAARLKATRPGMKLMVAGCLYQRYPQMQARIPEVDYWVTEPAHVHLESTVRRVLADLGRTVKRTPGEPELYRRKVLLSEPGSAFLRISQGCDRTCAFCAIPIIKGPLVGRRIDELVREASWLSDRYGVREINLVAQDLTSFGAVGGGSAGDARGFLDLLRALEGVRRVRWYRLHYVYPFGLDAATIEFLARSDRFAHYLDMPVQHGDDAMLRIMRRGGTYRSLLDHLAKIRASWPSVAIRTTVLVGHPGETERRFQRLMDFIQEARFEWLGCFVYSREDGTRAAALRHRTPPRATARDRASQVLDAWRSARSTDVFGIGQVKDVLIVRKERTSLIARSETEAPDVDGVIRIRPRPRVEPGLVLRARITGTDDVDFTGELV